MAGPIQAVTVVEALLLRTRLPELPLRDGASFVARVASRGEGGAASLVIAGELISATVPDDVRSGQTLRLTVAEVTQERVVLRMEPGPAQGQQAAAQPPPPPAPAPQARVRVEQQPGGRGRRGGAGEHGVTLVVETPALGTLRVRVATAPAAVVATVQVPQAVLERAQARAEQLRAGLQREVGRPASVSIVGGAVDVRA